MSTQHSSFSSYPRYCPQELLTISLLRKSLAFSVTLGLGSRGHTIAASDTAPAILLGSLTLRREGTRSP